MLAEFCPSHGAFCRTTYADLRISPEKLFTTTEILMTQSIDLATHASLISLQHSIDLLRHAMRTLEGYKTHPGDATLIGVPADQIRSLEIVLARTETKQKNFIDGDVVAAAEAETAARRSALARLKPIINKAKTDVLSAEELLTALNDEPDPKVARGRFLSFSGDSLTVRDEQEILKLADARPLPKKYAAANSYTLTVIVTSVDVTSADAHFTLIDKFLPSPLFTNADVGFRKVITHIADSGDLRCLNLCMAYGVSVPVELAISVNIGGAGLGYTATLIRLVNRADTMNSLKKTMETENQSLFD